MTVGYAPKVDEAYIKLLRDKYSTICGVEVIPPDFPNSLAQLVLATHIVLEHEPNNPLAKARMRAITEYFEKFKN